MSVLGRNVAFLSTYPPRECGIATFTQDLVNEIKKIKLINFAGVIAIMIIKLMNMTAMLNISYNNL